jgi:hypothetical protein
MQLRTAVILLAAGIPALTQPQVFVYLAPGASLTRAFAGDAFVHSGGGGEYVMKKGIGVGAEGGVIGVLFGGHAFLEWFLPFSASTSRGPIRDRRVFLVL